jgi:hypothetical protein
MIPGTKVKLHMCNSQNFVYGFDNPNEAARVHKWMMQHCPISCTVRQYTKHNNMVSLDVDDIPGVKTTGFVEQMCFDESAQIPGCNY